MYNKIDIQLHAQFGVNDIVEEYYNHVICYFVSGMMGKSGATPDDHE